MPIAEADQQRLSKEFDTARETHQLFPKAGIFEGDGDDTEDITVLIEFIIFRENGLLLDLLDVILDDPRFAAYQAATAAEEDAISDPLFEELVADFGQPLFDLAWETSIFLAE